MAKPKVIVSRNLAPAGDDKLRLRGTFQVTNLSPAISPLFNGFSFAVYGQSGATLVSGFIPPGLRVDSSSAGWRTNSQGTRFSYKDGAGTLTPGIRSAGVSHKVNTAIGLFAFSLSGKDGSFHVDPSELPLRLDVVLGGAPQALAGQCGTATFNPEIAERPNCKVRQEGNAITCG
jgi:hypothetical protein